MRKQRKDILNYSRIHLELLPRGRKTKREKDPLGNIYQTYIRYLKNFPLWVRLQTKLFYASPTSSLAALLQMRWRRQALKSLQAKPEPKVTKKEARAKINEIQLVERMRWSLVEDLRRHLLEWKCVTEPLAAVMAGRLALRLLTKPKKRSMLGICMEEARRLIAKEKHPNYNEMMDNLRLLAIEELPKIQRRAWLRLAEWKGKLVDQPLPVAPEEKERRKAGEAVLKKQGLEVRKFFTCLLCMHAECLARLSREKGKGTYE